MVNKTKSMFFLGLTVYQVSYLTGHARKASNIGMVLNLLRVCHLQDASCKLILNISSDFKGYQLNIPVTLMITSTQ